VEKLILLLLPIFAISAFAEMPEIYKTPGFYFNGKSLSNEETADAFNRALVKKAHAIPQLNFFTHEFCFVGSLGQFTSDWVTLPFHKYEIRDFSGDVRQPQSLWADLYIRSRFTDIAGYAHRAQLSEEIGHCPLEFGPFAPILDPNQN